MAPPRPNVRVFSSMALLLVATAIFALGAQAQSPTARPVAGDLYADIIPSMAGQVEAQTAGKLPVYTVSGFMVPASEQPGRIEGTLSLDYVNFTTEEQSEICLRLYPNFEDYGGGS